MFGVLDPETHALARLRKRCWNPVEPDVLSAADDDHGDDDDPRWEEYVRRWEQDDYPDYPETHGEDDE